MRNLLNSPSDKSLSPISPPQSSSIGTLSPSMQLICHVCNALCSSVLPSVFHFTLVPASFSLIVCHPCGLPAITPPVHQHMGQEGGMYADIWTVIPTIDMACHCPAGSGLQYGTHTGFKDTHPSRMARKLD